MAEQQCSICKAFGSNGFMSKTQQKKQSDKRRCVSCVNNVVNLVKPAEKHIDNEQIHKIVVAPNNNKQSTETVNRKRKLIDGGDVNDICYDNMCLKSQDHSLSNRKLHKIREFYAKHCPSKSQNIDLHNRLLQQFNGDIGFIMNWLNSKYNKSSSVEESIHTNDTISKSVKNSLKKKKNLEAMLPTSIMNTETLNSKNAKTSLLSSSASSSLLKCDKCDGQHETDKCPYFKKGREKHADALNRRPGADIGSSGGNVVARNGRVISQPGDGSCLFHSLFFGLSKLGLCNGQSNGRAGATALRREIAKFIALHPKLLISDTPVSSWVKWDSGMNVNHYCQQMSRGGSWGGGIELAGCSLLKHVNIHVYERLRSRGGGGGMMKRISCFNYPKSKHTIYVLYGGRLHYDALILDPTEVKRIENLKNVTSTTSSSTTSSSTEAILKHKNKKLPYDQSMTSKQNNLKNKISKSFQKFIPPSYEAGNIDIDRIGFKKPKTTYLNFNGQNRMNREPHKKVRCF